MLFLSLLINRRINIGLFLSCIFIPLLFIQCKKETVIYPSPSIKIISTEIKALTTFEVIVEIDRGEGQILKHAELVFEDITVEAMSKIIEPIQLTEEKVKQYKISVNTNRLNHDFFVVAKLETDKYSYSSESKTVRSLKNNLRIEFVNVKDEDLYVDQFIGLKANPGYEFIVTVQFTTNFKPTSIKVMLNNGVALEHTITFSNISQGSEYYSTEGNVKIPENLAPGLYELSLVVDGISFKCSKKLQVLKGRWSLFDKTYAGEKRGDYAWFVLDDKLYLVGGEFYVTMVQRAPVQVFDLKNKIWSCENDVPIYFPVDGNLGYVRILPFQLQYGGDGYILVRNYQKIDLWRFGGISKRWEKISEYPGVGDYYMTCFIAGDKLLLGGGVDYAEFPVHDMVCVQDFWSYSFTTQKWERKSNMPFKPAPYLQTACGVKNKGYVLEISREFWEYDSLSDRWSGKCKFPGMWRYAGNIVSDGMNLYLIGGNYDDFSVMGNITPPLRDCWKFGPEENLWEQKAFLSAYTSHGIAFFYNNKIVNGLGYYVESRYDYMTNNQILYELATE